MLAVLTREGDAAFSSGFATIINAMVVLQGNNSLSIGAEVGIGIGVTFVWAALNALRIDQQGWLNNLAAVFQIGSTISIVIVLLVVAPTRATAHEVFTSTYNSTGFPFAYVCLIGILSTLFSFSGYEAGAHLSEETRHAGRAVPLRASMVHISPNARWSTNGITIAGGNEQGSETNQFNHPWGLYVDDNQTIYVADTYNHRILEWKSGATNGTVIAGGNGQENEAHQLNYPQDVIIDKESDSLIISDHSNKRVVRWLRRNDTRGETIISNISCIVRRYKIGNTRGTVVAGGNGQGCRLDQLSHPFYVFVDQDHSLYVSEYGNHRVMKWEKGAKQGIVVAGGQGEGNSLTQLAYPKGVVVDQLGTVYVADDVNHRIMRWPKGATQGSVIIGGNGEGAQSNQLNEPVGLSFDRYGNLYVVENGNHRVQKFNIEQTQFR
ncbi:unnamed protein product [Rotaria sp. Silwood1]|nr:unnamed protein product [Rotaria sp. Silwood1]